MFSIKYLFSFLNYHSDNSKYIHLASVLEIILTQQKENYKNM